MTDTDPWLTEKEAARELGVSPGTVRRERLDRKLGYSTVRGRIFYPLSQVTAYKLGQTKPCRSTTASSSDLTLITGTLAGPKDAVASAVRQAQRMKAKLNSSS